MAKQITEWESDLVRQVDINEKEIKKLNTAQEIINDRTEFLDNQIWELERKAKRDGIINIVWTICVGIIVFLLLINY